METKEHGTPFKNMKLNTKSNTKQNKKLIKYRMGWVGGTGITLGVTPENGMTVAAVLDFYFIF